MTLDELQSELCDWLNYNFPRATSDQQLKGVMEELGELCHADLKTEQKIRGYDDVRGREEIKDAVGDLTIYLINYCNVNQMKFSECIDLAYQTIKKRDWIKNPKGY